MRTRLTWIVAILALVSIGVLMACSTKYSSSSNGLVVVPSQGGGVVNQGGPVMETFSLDLANGSLSQINNVNGPPTPGLPTAVVLDPAGAFAYVIITQSPAVPNGGGTTGIATFPIASDGKLGAATAYTLNQASVTVQVNGQNTAESVPVVPVALTIDSAGKLLFVANGATSDSSDPANPVPGSISVLAIGNNASLTEVPGSPFVLPVNGINMVPPNPCTSQVACPSPLALAVTPTLYPPRYGYCSGFTPPTTEDLYVTDSVNYVVLNYSVNLSTGALGPPLNSTTVQSFPTGSVPSGVAVDPCNRFVYVSNGLSNAATANTVSAYTICSSLSQSCPRVDFSLIAVKGSPFPISPGEGPGPLAVDPYGGYLYVVDTMSGLVSQFRISPSTGALTPLTPPSVVAGGGANSIAIRSDDSFLFVANINPGTLSQYSINIATGALNPLPTVQTFTLPSGVAVK